MVPLSQAIVTVVGMGLMGGSLAKALVSLGACKEVRALVRHGQAAEEAVTQGAAHFAGTDPEELLHSADLVVLATPVRTIEQQVTETELLHEVGRYYDRHGECENRNCKGHEWAPRSYPCCRRTPHVR